MVHAADAPVHRKGRPSGSSLDVVDAGARRVPKRGLRRAGLPGPRDDAPDRADESARENDGHDGDEKSPRAAVLAERQPRREQADERGDLGIDEVRAEQNTTRSPIIDAAAAARNTVSSSWESPSSVRARLAERITPRRRRSEQRCAREARIPRACRDKGTAGGRSCGRCGRAPSSSEIGKHDAERPEAEPGDGVRAKRLPRALVEEESAPGLLERRRLRAERRLEPREKSRPDGSAVRPRKRRREEERREDREGSDRSGHAPPGASALARGEAREPPQHEDERRR